MFVIDWFDVPCRCFEESDGFGTHFADGYLEAVESVDRKALFESTMAGQNRLLLRFDPRLNSKTIAATRSQRIWAIVQDVAKNGEFSYVTERRQIFVLVRSSVGEEVAEALCVLLECQCSILRLVDLPQDQGLIRRDADSKVPNDHRRQPSGADPAFRPLWFQESTAVSRHFVGSPALGGLCTDAGPLHCEIRSELSHSLFPACTIPGCGRWCGPDLLLGGSSWSSGSAAGLGSSDGPWDPIYFREFPGGWSCLKALLWIALASQFCVPILGSSGLCQ